MMVSRSGIDLSTLFFVLLCTLSVVSACFITNCPVGGKRSLMDPKTAIKRQCSTCGPRGMGHCFGPHICCGHDMGCHVGTKDTFVCQLEDAYPVPCDNEGESCGESVDGKCAAEGVCCSSDHCIVDDSCKQQHTGFPNSVLFPFHSRMALHNEQIQ